MLIYVDVFCNPCGYPHVSTLGVPTFVIGIRLSEVHRKPGAELVSDGIVGRNLGTKQKVPSHVPPYNAIVDEFARLRTQNQDTEDWKTHKTLQKQTGT